MPFAQFLKQGVGDMLLCAVCGAALAYIVSGGFYASVFLRSWPFVIAGVAAAASVALYCVSYNARTAAIGSAALFVAFIVAVAICARVSTSSALFADEAGNYALACVIVFVPLLAVFLLSRKRMLCAVLLVAGVFSAGIVEYLYGYGDVASLVLFGLAAIALSIYRTYQKSLLDSESDAMAFNAVTVGGLAFAALSMALGFCVFMLVIAPLDPPAAEIKLITEHYRIQYEHVRGIGDSTTVLGEQYSNQLSDDEQMGNRDSNDIESQQEENALAGDDDQQGADTLGTSGTAQGILAEEVVLWALIVLLVLLIVCALAVLVKLMLRKRWFDSACAKSGEEQVGEFYRFFLDRFSRLALACPQGKTLAEFARDNENAFSLFERTAPVPAGFGQLTESYMRVVYGHEEASDEEAARFRAYYKGFYKNVCGYVGRWKYLFKFFRM